MKDKRIQKLYFLAGMIMAAFLMADAPEVKAEESKKVVVAFPQVEGLSETDETGSRSGIVYEFLSEIAKYTDWEYEFVEGDYEILIEDLYKGKIDLIGGMYYREQLKDRVAYPQYSMGCKYSLIFANKSNEEIKGYDRRTMNGKTIGVYANAKDKIERLEKYLDYHKLECELVYYDDAEEYLDCLKNGETDLMLGSDTDHREDYNVIDTFVSEDSYLAVSAKSKELLPELNAALEKIYRANPDFAEEVYEKYFDNTDSSIFYLNKEEKEFVAGCEPIRVAVIRERYPLCYSYNNEEKGIIVDVLALIHERTGLVFELVEGDSYQEVIDLVKTGDADIAGYFMDSNDVAGEYGFIITQPYIETNEVMIVNKGVTYPSEHLTIVLPEGKVKEDYIKAENIIYAEDCFECVRKVNRGQADITYMPYIFAEAAFQKENISNVKEMALYNRKTSISFAFSRSASHELYYIINKAINNISENEINMVIDNNQLIMKENFSTLKTLINVYPGVFIGIISVFIMLIAFIIMVIWHSRMKHKLMIYELEKAEATSEVKSEFLSRVSVKLRTPVNRIIGLTKLIRMTEKTSPEVEEKLEEIETSSQYLHFLLDNVLDMSRIHNKEIHVQIAPFHVEQLITKIKYIASFQSEERDVCFTAFSDIKHPVFLGDVLKIEQSIINLLDNAFRFSAPNGKVEFRVEESEGKEGSAVLRFAVRDNGVGIEEEERKKMLELFEQPREADNGRDGSGLGLSISEQLVKMMGGKMGVESTAEKETEFYFVLELPIGRVKEEMGDFGGMKVLLAEDNEWNAAYVVSLFEQVGILTEHAVNGQQAVDMFLGHPEGYYDLILMDIQMPIMDGWEAFERIRNSGRKDAAAVFISAITADVSEDTKEKVKRVGMDAFLSKPLEIKEVYQVFRNCQNKKFS